MTKPGATPECLVRGVGMAAKYLDAAPGGGGGGALTHFPLPIKTCPSLAPPLKKTT